SFRSSRGRRICSRNAEHSKKLLALPANGSGGICSLARKRVRARARVREHGGPMLFADRREAGRILAGLLTKYADRHDVLVLALPRGGVPVAFEVAYALK